jgi:hypothetical protein
MDEHSLEPIFTLLQTCFVGAFKANANANANANVNADAKHT